MGNVSSRVGDEGSPLYLRDQTRFFVTAVTVTGSRNRVLLSIAPNQYPATTYAARRETGDDTLVDFVQDPEPTTSPIPSFLVKVPHDDELTFNFTFVVRQVASPHQPQGDATAISSTSQDTNINGLTFIFAPTIKDLDNLVTKELHADPNLHKNNPNVQLVGDYSTGGSPSVQATWSWKWKPPRPNEDKGGGWKNCCSFVEYDQRLHKLSPLASFAFWVQNSPRAIVSPITPSPRLEVVGSMRLRVPSAQSVDSRISDSDGVGDAKEAPPPPSPIIEGVPEEGLSLVPTASASTATTAVPAPVKVDISCQRPGEDVSAVEDGPLFRATMKAMEQKTGTMKARWKKVLKRAESAWESQKAYNDAISGLTEALREASLSNANAVQPAMEHYFDRIAREILKNDMASAQNLQKLVIEPISKLYTMDIKQAEFKKRDFEEESKDYYAFLGRYLGQRQDSLKEKKREQTDTKYQVRRRNFELKRFDYSSYLQDLHGGRKDQEVLSHLTKYADAQARGYLATAKKIEHLLPQLEALTSEVKEADKEFQIHRTEREEKRRTLEKSAPAYIEPEGAAGLYSQQSNLSTATTLRPGTEGDSTKSGSLAIRQVQSPTSPAGTNGGVVPSPGNSGQQAANALGTSPGSISNKFKGYRDLEEKEPSTSGEVNAGHRKEGLVWALSRPGSHLDPKGINKQAWHKFWIVLDQGKLSEYTNWKQKLDLHMDPIDLRVASVREARNAERRFCFEIITPQFTRVYQAQTEEDMKTWIATINNALQSAVEGKGVADLVPTDSPSPSNSIRKDIASVLTGKSASTGHRSSYHHHSTLNKTVGRHATVGERPSYKPPAPEINESSQRLLKQLREADAGNQYCADCGSDQKVEWVSINLGIIICIECSGIHRSLGTHISKVRSLTLDPNAFTLDVVELLLKVGNRIANLIWEAKMDKALKPGPQSNREQRLKFITAKYGERAYVQPLSPTLSPFGTPDETLLASIKKNDIQNIVYALALRANPDSHDRSRNTHAVFLALAAADPATPSGAPSPLPSPRAAKSPGTATQAPSATRTAFPVAELLLLNGAELPSTPAPIPLSASARLYIEGKAEQRNGRGAAKAGVNLTDDGVNVGGGDTLTALPEFRPAGKDAANATPAERARERDERLRKRLSAGGRLVRQVGGVGGGAGG